MVVIKLWTDKWGAPPNDKDNIHMQTLILKCRPIMYVSFYHHIILLETFKVINDVFIVILENIQNN